MKLVNILLKILGFKRVSVKKVAELLSIMTLIVVLSLPVAAQAST